MVDGRDLVQRYLEAVNRRDGHALRALLHADYVDEMPQSGERIRGCENYIAMLEHYPGQGEDTRWADPARTRVFGADSRWLMTPGFTVLSVEGGGDTYTVVFGFPFVDGAKWHAARVIRIADGKIVHSISVYGQDFDPPEWRAQWVERI